MNYKVLQSKYYKPYKAAIEKEIAIEHKSVGKIPDYSKCIDIHPIINKYINLGIANIDSGIEGDWFRILPELIGKRMNGLSLGSGTGRHQIMLLNLGIVERWNSVDLVINRGKMLIENNIRIVEIENDLNFIELEREKYDLIYCHGLLHHIVNLEHLILQINDALTNDGVFVFEEYVGEDQWQWSKMKIKLINDFIKKKFNSLYEGTILKKYSLNALKSTRPLESIRSSDIPRLIKDVFKESILEYKTLPIGYPIINSLPRAVREKLLNNETLLNDFLIKVVEFDKKISKEMPELIPCLQIGIYKKNLDIRLDSIIEWKKSKLDRKLLPSITYSFPRITYRFFRNMLFG